MTGRFSHKTGDTSRLARDQAAQSQVASSPLLGYGAPQQATAVTHTKKCVGTESEIFLLLFSHGVPALFLFGAWMAYTIVRTAKTAVARLTRAVLDPRRADRRLRAGAVLRAHGTHAVHPRVRRPALPRHALQSDLRSADRARERLRGWRLRRPPAPGLSLDGD